MDGYQIRKVGIFRPFAELGSLRRRCVFGLHMLKFSNTEIGHLTGLSRTTIRKYIAEGCEIYGELVERLF